MSSLRYSLRRQYVDAFFCHQATMFRDGAQVLDLGGTKIDKRGKFNLNTYNLAVIYANLGMEKQPDVQADAAILPFACQSFDIVICGELLEHVPNPAPVLAQAWAVLKPTGRLLISVPFLYHIHGDPYDYGRYTDHYWQEQLNAAGFTKIVIERHGLFFSVLLDMIKQFLNYKVRRPWRWFLQPFWDRLEMRIQRYESRSRIQNDKFIRSFTTGFGIVAEKPMDTHLTTEEI